MTMAPVEPPVSVIEQKDSNLPPADESAMAAEARDLEVPAETPVIK
jgi:hypothetical protein